MNDDMRDLIFRAIDESISDGEFELLQDAIAQDPDVRKFYLSAVNLNESLTDIASTESDAEDFGAAAVSRVTVQSDSMASSGLSPNPRGRNRFALPAITAIVLVAVALTALYFDRFSDANVADGDVNSPRTQLQPQNTTDPADSANEAEDQIAGHAMLRRIVNFRGVDGAEPVFEGEVLQDGAFVFESGVAEIDFFCGATLIVEGPAELDIESDWCVRVVRGRMRANVPRAARGFVIKTAESEIVDLGTEFVLDVGEDDAHVEVVDGEVELRGGKHDGVHLTTGQGQLLSGPPNDRRTFEGVSTASDVRTLRDAAIESRYNAWEAAVAQVSADPRLIAFFPMESTGGDNSPLRSLRVVTDASHQQNDAMMVGPVGRTGGRFGRLSSGLEFGRAGARVRTMIEGEFSAYTFCCWVRIDSLEHSYNALFMGDGYENGEPHWQIREDGRLMFSVMVDDSKSPVVANSKDGRPVKDAGVHRVYFTEPFWDLSKSGQWFHLVAVYDPQARRVIQYVNGKAISDAKIEDRFYIDKLRIGAAEIGNWGQPFRLTPWFAVRNLNGVIDELSIYSAALPGDEIEALYNQGKPVGY